MCMICKKNATYKKWLEVKWFFFEETMCELSVLYYSHHANNVGTNKSVNDYNTSDIKTLKKCTLVPLMTLWPCRRR